MKTELNLSQSHRYGLSLIQKQRISTNPWKKQFAQHKLKEKNWKRELYRFLLNYQATPHLTTKHAPAQLLFNREIRTKLPSKFHKNISELDEEVRENDKKAKQIMKENADRRSRAEERIVEIGDLVLVGQKQMNKFSTRFDPRPYRVVRVKMTTACRDGQCYEEHIILQEIAK